MRKLSFLITFLLLFGCTSSKIESFNSELKNIEQHYAPDKTLAVFDVQLQKKSGNWILKGETTSKMAKDAILKNTKTILRNAEFIDSLIVLPHPDLEGDTVAVAKVSVVNLRRKPGASQELVDQVILGDKLRILKKQGRWLLVQTEYDYLGWVTVYTVEILQPNSEWFTKPMLQVTTLNGNIYSEPSEYSEVVCDVVLNARVNLIGKGLHWLEVALPDGRTGYIKKSIVRNMEYAREKFSVDKLVVTAKSMMGLPYLWGASSSKMNDCSGFTSTVFLAHGIQLPRDARQQALIGKTVEFDRSMETVKPGDLLFFGSKERISHVGISLGGYEYIHQDSYVSINSFDPLLDNKADRRFENLKIIKRVI
jgi:uncharacterized protein YgiM (DUF1202 family)